MYRAVPTAQAIRMLFLDGTATAATCGVVLLYILMSPDGWVAKFLSLRWMRTLGNMAYSTYLFHPIILCVVFRAISRKDPFLNSPSDLLPITLACIVTLTISLASWEFLESNLVRLGHR